MFSVAFAFDVSSPRLVRVRARAVETFARMRVSSGGTELCAFEVDAGYDYHDCANVMGSVSIVVTSDEPAYLDAIALDVP